METLTLEKAQALVQEIIAENGGSEAKYEKLDDGPGGCQYVHRFDESGASLSSRATDIAKREWGCLVGRVLGKAGVPIEWFSHKQENFFSDSLHVTPLREQGILDIEGDAETYLREAQRKQDRGATWVDADRRASEYVKKVTESRGTEG